MKLYNQVKTLVFLKSTYTKYNTNQNQYITSNVIPILNMLKK